MNNTEEITKKELLYTYKKVKQELFYEKDSIIIDNIIKFENDLDNQINQIVNQLNNKNKKFFLTESSIGSFNFIFKNIKLIDDSSGLKIKYTVNNFDKKLFKIEKLSYRYMGNISMVFQMIGGLWINSIGYRLENLLPENLYGCRIKKYNNELEKQYYEQNNTFYKPYFSDYRKWQDNLFNIMKENPAENIQIFTADITKYYHSININILKRKIDTYIEKNEIELSENDKFIHDLLFEMIIFFNQTNNGNYSFFENKSNGFGLPLTLNVSRILSNFYLLNFDKDLMSNVKPLYYGRYVDDLIIAFKHDEVKSFNDALHELKEHKVSINEGAQTDEKEVVYTLTDTLYSEFKLEFNSSKFKNFLFKYDTDSVEINYLRDSINKTSSEWKLLPTTVEYEDIKKVDLFYSDNIESTPSIRKSGKLILKRNRFIREILNFESFLNNSTNSTWKKRLNNFLILTEDYIFDVKNFIDLNRFIPRVFGLLIHCDNEPKIVDYFKKLDDVLLLLEKYSGDKEFTKAKEFLNNKILENIICNNSLNKVNSYYILKKYACKKELFTDKVLNYFNCDLHIEPYKNIFFKYEQYKMYLKVKSDLDAIKSVFLGNDEKITKFLNKHLLSNSSNNESSSCNVVNNSIFNSSGFYYYTRRISLLELTISFKNLILDKNEGFKDLANLYYHDYDVVLKNKLTDPYLNIDINNSTIKENNPIICNTHFLTKNESFDCVIRDLQEKDDTREDRILKLVNHIISNSLNIDYLVFHELALPRNLYLMIATRLSQSNINLIAGLEYKIDKSKLFCDNQLVYILNNNKEFGSSIALYQSKLEGAIHESSEIRNKANLRIKGSYDKKLIINN